MKLSTALAAALAALLLSACSSELPARITDATTGGDPSRVRVELDTCHAELSVDVQEQDDAVRVTVTATDDHPDPCAQFTVVDLERPLGDRDLIDGNTGDVVPVEDQNG